MRIFIQMRRSNDQNERIITESITLLPGCFGCIDLQWRYHPMPRYRWTKIGSPCWWPSAWSFWWNNGCFNTRFLRGPQFGAPSDIFRYMFTWWPYLPWKCGQTLPVELTEPVAKISHLERPVGSVARVENTRCCSNNHQGMMDPWDSEKNRDGWKHSIQWNDGSPTSRVQNQKLIWLVDVEWHQPDLSIVWPKTHFQHAVYHALGAFPPVTCLSIAMLGKVALANSSRNMPTRGGWFERWRVKPAKRFVSMLLVPFADTWIPQKPAFSYRFRWNFVHRVYKHPPKQKEEKTATCSKNLLVIKVVPEVAKSQSNLGRISKKSYQVRNCIGMWIWSKKRKKERKRRLFIQLFFLSIKVICFDLPELFYFFTKCDTCRTRCQAHL